MLLKASLAKFYLQKCYMCFSFWGNSSPDLLPELCPWTPLGTSVPQTPYAVSRS